MLLYELKAAERKRAEQGDDVIEHGRRREPGDDDNEDDEARDDG